MHPNYYHSYHFCCFTEDKLVASFRMIDHGPVNVSILFNYLVTFNLFLFPPCSGLHCHNISSLFSSFYFNGCRVQKLQNLLKVTSKTLLILFLMPPLHAPTIHHALSLLFRDVARGDWGGGGPWVPVIPPF